jgi:hypothetical protein
MRAIASLLVSFALLLFCSSAWSRDNKSIQGTVTGPDGRPLADAGIRAERLDTKATPVITKTDAKGQYAFRALPVGVYAITVTVKSVPKSRGKIKTTNNGWVRVDFDMRPSANSAQQPKDTGRSPAIDNLSRMQQSLGGNINGMSFPGH